MMTEGMLAFVVWLLCGLIFYGIAAYSFLTKKSVPMGFWANAKMFPVTDVKAYNRSMGKLWLGFATVFIALGLPLLTGGVLAILMPSVGVMLEAVGTMVIYVCVIEPKYRKKNGE